MTHVIFQAVCYVHMDVEKEDEINLEEVKDFLADTVVLYLEEKNEEDQIEGVLAAIAPLTMSSAP